MSTSARWLDVVLVVALLSAVALSTARLLGRSGPPVGAGYIGSRGAEVGHLAMSLGMLAMLAPWWRPESLGLLVGYFALIALSYLVLLILGARGSRSSSSRQRPAHAYHLVAGVAMAYACTLPTNTGDAASRTQDMAASMTHGATGSSLLTWTMVALFILDFLGTAVVLVVAPQQMLPAPPVDPSSVRSSPAPRPRTALGTPTGVGQVGELRRIAVPHLVMDASMATMLLAMIS